jgi:hypothetical protein
MRKQNIQTYRRGWVGMDDIDGCGVRKKPDAQNRGKCE